jgi:hypothetical protein
VGVGVVHPGGRDVDDLRDLATSGPRKRVICTARMV